METKKHSATPKADRCRVSFYSNFNYRGKHLLYQYKALAGSLKKRWEWEHTFFSQRLLKIFF